MGVGYVIMNEWPASYQEPGERYQDIQRPLPEGCLWTDFKRNRTPNKMQICVIRSHFLDTRNECVLHGHGIQGNGNTFPGREIESFFLISKNRAKTVNSMPASGMGLGGKWQGRHIASGSNVCSGHVAALLPSRRSSADR